MDRLFVNVQLATMRQGGEPYGLVRDGALSISNGIIAWAGPSSDLPQHFGGFSKIDCAGRLMTPALVDCHTHVVHGGNRAREFEMRLEGASYEDIARAGGGIVSTVAATRQASEDELLSQALRRVDALIAEGVTTLEIKSGYGLDIETELRMLRVARRVEGQRPIRVKTSFLGAHAIPAPYKGRAASYIAEACIPALRAAHAEGLVDAVDGFMENIAFDEGAIRAVFDVAQALGLPVKLHAEQLSNMGGAKLAASYGALSCDHLEHLDDDGCLAMKSANSVAVLLPGAFYFIREKQVPPIDLLRKHGIPIAVATDCNPGSSPLTSLLLAMNMAATFFRLTPEDCLRGVTVNGARALGLSDCGVLEPGRRADLALWDVGHPHELSYRIGFNPLYRSYFAGVACQASS